MKNVFAAPSARLVALAAAAAVALGAVAATAGAAPSAGVVVRDGGLTIGLPGIPPVFMAVRSEVADKDGFYKKYGANVTLKLFTTGTDGVKAVQAGQVDAAWAPTPFALKLMSKGVPLVAIEGLDVVDWLVGSMDGSITKCSQLKGQTISVDALGGARYAALQAMLRHCGLTIDDVKTVALPGDAAVQAMIAGQIKLAVLHVDEVAQIERQVHKTVTTVVDMSQADPDQHYDMLVTTQANLAAKRAEFVKLLAGDIAATRYLYNPHNLANVSKIATVTGRDQGTAAIAIKKYIALKWWPYDWSGLGIAKITRTIGLNVKLGNISPSANLTWKDVVDSGPWKQAFALVKKRQGK